MSEEDVQAVRDAFDAFERDGIDGLLAEPAVYRGHEAVRRHLTTMLGEFEEVHVEATELVDAGDHVLVSLRLSGRGKRSGAPVELTMTQVSTGRGGLAVRIRNYPTKAEALEAAGLSE
jgi:ketosteroid isomerase-like protein